MQSAAFFHLEEKPASMRYAFSLCLLVTAMLCHAYSFGQLISGKVLSERGLAASNISVHFKNKKNTVITRADGSFRIMATALPDTLVFAAAGYEPYSVVVTEKTVKDPHFEVVLLASRAMMSEVAATGYGASRAKRESRAVAAAAVRKDAEVDYDHSVTTAPVMAYGTASGFSSRGASGTSTTKKIYTSDTVTNPGIQRKSKVLTAGEVNDFRKWKMWEDYTESEFKSYSQKWELFPRQRYSVQLTNPDRKAIIGQKLQLVERSSGEVIWTAYTDNTGKAELWNGFRSTNAATTAIKIAGDDKVYAASDFANGINHIETKKSCAVTNKVEVAFVVDATGSMSDEIEFLKLELEDVIRSAFDKNTDLDLNIGSVFYRDEGDDYVTKYINFNNDLLKVLNFVKLQSAGGGGDYPEAVHSALITAIDSMNWSSDARAKIMFLFLDAPPHDQAKDDMFKLIQKAAAKGIRVVPVACSGTDKSTEFIMRSMALATNGTYIFLTDDSGVGGKHIKPTTDAFDVELLNTLLQRTLEQMIFVHGCSEQVAVTEPIKTWNNTVSLKLFPNPTNGNFTIETDKPLKEIFVTDFTGKILMRLNTSDKTNRYHVDISQYPAATYFIRYVTADSTWGAEKVVVVR